MTYCCFVAGTKFFVDLIRAEKVSIEEWDNPNDVAEENKSSCSCLRWRTYWFIRLVFPTPLSPKHITFKRTFFFDAILTNLEYVLFNGSMELRRISALEPTLSSDVDD